MRQMKNPISGRTRAEEIKIGLLCGGHLPFDVWQDLQRRRMRPRRKSKRRPSTTRDIEFR